MDPVKLEKVRAMNKYRRIQFLQVILQYCLTVLVLILCLSKSSWFISLCSSVKVFFIFTLPHIGSYVMNPKCLFVLCNMIIVILVGESKMGSASSSPASEAYDEYVLRIRSQSRSPLMEKKVDGLKRFDSSLGQASLESIQEVEEEDNKEADKEDGGGLKGEREQEEEKAEEEEEEAVSIGDEGEGDKADVAEEDDGLPTDELNRRVEDFIEMVNRQRKMEAEMLLCNG